MVTMTVIQFAVVLALIAFWFWHGGKWRGEVLERRWQAEKEARKTRARFEGIETQEPDVTHGETPGYWQGVKE